MSQTKKQTMREVACDTAIGITIAGVVNYVVLVSLKGYSPYITAIILTSVFTVVSVSRKYVMRRFFNWFDNRG